jgi:hypothetical protein
MLSRDLKRLGFGTWTKVVEDYDDNRDLILKLPKDEGIYVVRADKPISRIKGQSDIVYIGRGRIQSRIQQLLRSHLPINYRNYLTKHTAREAFERTLNETELELEFSYVIVDMEEVGETESELLKLYCKDHIEPPPCNNTRR